MPTDDFGAELDLLRSKLYDAVNQNLKLLSIIEISKGTNSVFTTENNLKLVTQTIQDAIEGHSFFLVIATGARFQCFYTDKETVCLDAHDRFEIPPISHTINYPAGSADLVGLFKAFRALNENLPSMLLPLASKEENRTLGYFVIQSSRPMNSEELRLVEICQRQVEKLLQINYFYELSNIDDLTQLYNRRYAEMQLNYELKRARRRKSNLAVLLIDLDKFKSVNDTHGHPAGDSVLKELGQLLIEEIREVDIACRFGGEEFMVILPDTDESAATLVAARIRSALEKKNFTCVSPPLKITCSIGIALFDLQDLKGYAELVEQADVALYQAKKGGRNACCVYDHRNTH